VPLEQLPRPRDEPLPKPPPQVPKPAIEVPPAAPRPQEPALSRGVQVVVRAFRFTGNTAISDAELQAIAAPYVGRPIGNAELEELRLAVTRRYVEEGYVNSGAVIPDQDVSDGTITLRIIEGRLSEIVVGGENHFAPAYLADRLALGAGPPLNVNRLQERMQLMLQDPQIERMEAQLAPGVGRGDAVLRVDVTEAKRFLAGLTLSNDRSPVVGEYQAEAFVAARNLLGRGDAFTLRAAGTEGVGDYSAGFSLPLSARGTLLNLRYTRTRSHVVEPPLDQLDIGAQSHSFDAALAHPIVESLQRVLTASIAFSRRGTQNFFLGQPSPFIPGAPDGSTTVSVLRLGLDGVMRSEREVVAGRVLFSRGLDALGATVSSDPAVPDSRFNALLGQFQWVRAVSKDGQIIVRADGQHANDALLGPEKYSLGGLDSVRGYRKDALVRDNGWFASAEYRHLVGRLPLGPNPSPGDGAIRVAAFADYGRAWDHDGPPNAPKVLASVGPGIRWEPAQGADFLLYYGVALRDLNTPTQGLSDRGIHFRFSLSRSF
jgi:hemolysin activation/secretion protein